VVLNQTHNWIFRCMHKSMYTCSCMSHTHTHTKIIIVLFYYKNICKFMLIWKLNNFFQLRYFFHSSLKRNVPTETCSFFSAKSSLTAVYWNNNRLLYSVMYTMERYCTSLYCIENPHWTRCLWRRVQYGFSIQYRRVLYISILYITLYNDLFIIQLKLSIL
jgi:hypothetical protein